MQKTYTTDQQPNMQEHCCKIPLWHSLMYAISIGGYFCVIPAIPLLFGLLKKENLNPAYFQWRLTLGVSMSFIVTLSCALLYLLAELINKKRNKSISSLLSKETSLSPERDEYRRIFLLFPKRSMRLSNVWLCVSTQFFIFSLLFQNFGQSLLCYFLCVILWVCFFNAALNAEKRHLLARRIFDKPEIVFWTHRVSSFHSPYKWARREIYSFHTVKGEVLEIHLLQKNAKALLDWFRSQNPSALLFNPSQGPHDNPPCPF